MGKLLLVTGDLATGKTTFATLLSKRYGINMFFKDSIKEVLGEHMGFADRQENLTLSKATVELMIFIYKEFCRLDKDLILESNFKEPELEKIHQLAKESGDEILTIVLRGDVNILHKRYLHRMNNENRHPVHLSTTLDVYEDFVAYIEKAREEKIPGTQLVVDADDFSYQSDEELLKQIDAFMV